MEKRESGLSIRAVYLRFKAERKSWGHIFAWLSAFFWITLQTISLLRDTLGLSLLPMFEPTFDGFKAWVHYFVDILLFNWIELVVNHLADLVDGGLSTLFSTNFDFVEVNFPPWWKDLSVVSFLLLRAQNSSQKLAAPISLDRMSEAEKRDWLAERAKGGLAGRVAEWLSWRLVMIVYRPASLVAWPFRKLLGKVAGDFLRDTIGASLQLGVLYLLHDTVVAVNTLGSNSTVAKMHRRFVLLLLLSLLSALVAGLLFLLFNGLFIEWRAESDRQ